MAGKRFFTGMSPQVYGQVAQSCGPEVAHIAGEGFFHMLKQFHEFFKQTAFIISVSGKGINFIIKICQTVAGISMMMG
jgi:hypothetical protein